MPSPNPPKTDDAFTRQFRVDGADGEVKVMRWDSNTHVSLYLHDPEDDEAVFARLSPSEAVEVALALTGCAYRITGSSPAEGKINMIGEDE